MLADCYSHTGAYEKALTLLNIVAVSHEGINIPGHISANDILMQLMKEQTGVYQSGDYFSKD